MEDQLNPELRRLLGGNHAEIEVLRIHSENVRCQIESNDPDLVSLRVGYDDVDQKAAYFPYDQDWESDGESIGRNTNIKELILDQSGYGTIETEEIEIFFNGVSNNRSIQKLIFRRCNLFNGKIFATLIPMFKNNAYFEHLSVQCYIDPGRYDILALALGRFDSLSEFSLAVGASGNDNEVQLILQSLVCHQKLRKLTLFIDSMRSSGVWCALATLLQHPRSKLSILDLNNVGMSNEGAGFLARGLAGNSHLRDLNLSALPCVTSSGWKAIFTSLNGPSCRVEHLNLSCDKNIDDEAAIYLSRALKNNSHLKSLDLGYNYFTTSRRRAIFIELPKCLEELRLQCSSLGDLNREVTDEMTLQLLNCIFNVNSLKSLNISDNGFSSDVGWQALASFLQCPRIVLVTLDISANCISEEAIVSLGNAISNNSSRLRELCLNCLIRDTSGWGSFFSAVLPNSALEKLRARNNEIDEEALIVCANELENNRKLVELNISNCKENITDAAWDALSRALCNDESIINTYQSNHTLQILHDDDEDLPTDLVSLLKINREHEERQAARIKIINHHFCDGFISYPFVDMDLNVLPYALAWMSRDCEGDQVNVPFYRFLRSMPSLCDHRQQQKEEKEGVKN